jgi:hypothetical protein
LLEIVPWDILLAKIYRSNMKQYLDLMNDILENGTQKTNRHWYDLGFWQTNEI